MSDADSPTQVVDLSVVLKIYEKVMDQLIHYRTSMLKIFLGAGAVYSTLLGWYVARNAPDVKTSTIFLLAVLLVSFVSKLAVGVLQKYAHDALYVINGCEESLGCWEQGRFVPGRSLMPDHWRESASRKWKGSIANLHNVLIIMFILASVIAVLIQTNGMDAAWRNQ